MKKVRPKKGFFLRLKNLIEGNQYWEDAEICLDFCYSSSSKGEEMESAVVYLELYYTTVGRKKVGRERDEWRERVIAGCCFWESSASVTAGDDGAKHASREEWGTGVCVCPTDILSLLTLTFNYRYLKIPNFSTLKFNFQQYLLLGILGNM